MIPKIVNTTTESKKCSVCKRLLAFVVDHYNCGARGYMNRKSKFVVLDGDDSVEYILVCKTCAKIKGR